MRIIEISLSIDTHVIAVDLSRSLVDAVPRAEVGPSEVALHHIHVIALLQDAVVEAHIRERREVLLHEFVLLRYRPIGAREVEIRQHRRQERCQAFPEIFDICQEEARIPVPFTAVDEHLRKLAVGFLGESLYLIYIVLTRIVAELDIAIARFGSRGFHAHRQQTVVLSHEVEPLKDILLEDVLLEYSLITRCDDKIRLRVDMLNTVTGPRHARCGIAVNGLSHNMIAVDIGQLLHNIVQILLRGVDEDILLRNYLCKTFVSLLQLCTSDAEEIDKLLRLILAAARP